MAAETEQEEFICRCNPCLCDEPPPVEPKEEAECKCEVEPCDCSPKPLEPEKKPSSERFASKSYKLNEYMRAKQLLKQMSTKSGISLYDHLGEVIVKALDFYAPTRALNFVEEISLNVKRYRFQESQDSLNDCFYISKNVFNDAALIVGNWPQNMEWSITQQDLPEGEKKWMAAFPSFQRFIHYLEQINVSLQREEAFRLSLSIRQFYMTRPFIDRVRFFGKIFGSQKNYYVLEAEALNQKAVSEDNKWIPKASTTSRYFRKIQKLASAAANPEGTATEDDVSDNLPGAGDTFARAGKAVTDPDILLAYQATSGLPADTRNLPAVTTYTTTFTANKSEDKDKTDVGMVAAALEALNFTFDDPDAIAEQQKWEAYQEDLIADFPTIATEEVIEVPEELEGAGANRRCFYICNNIGDKWILLPGVTPQQINHSRINRWYLTGNLNAKVKTFPKFPGREGHYLRALLARITSGAQVSPKGYFKTSRDTRRRPSTENDDDFEDEELGEDEEEIREEGDDTVYPAIKFDPPKISSLLDPGLELWCHHTGYILPQGRFVWWNPAPPLNKKKAPRNDDDSEYDSDEEEEGEDAADLKKEIGPMLFQSLVEDQSAIVKPAWTPRASLTIFKDFQLAGVQSNIWPGATAICTAKGKSENVYIGDGLKFYGRCFAPVVAELSQAEYPADGPELKEIVDPSVEQEQNWLSKLQLLEIADVEDEFVDNEVPPKRQFDEDDD